MRQTGLAGLAVLAVALVGAVLGWQPLYAGPHYQAGQALALGAACLLAVALDRLTRRPWRVTGRV